MSGKKGYEKNQCMSDFYDGKSIFITGAAGFIGSVLLEIFLRCLPGINNIYILIRSKKGVQPEKRKNIIFKKKLFSMLLKENPNMPEKVKVIEGDVTHPNLGMSDEDFFEVTKEATIIFHVASTISFLRPLRYVATHNCLGLKNVIELARKFKKLEALIYTSTAYSNSNRGLCIEEIIYRLPWTGDRFLKALERDDGELEKLAAACKPDWPNNYTFTKCVAENIIADTASDLPIVIMRPSIVVATWRSPLRGYIEEGSGFLDLPLAVGKGFVKVLKQHDPNTRLDMVPADVVANAHIASAWAIATKRLPAAVVINCVAGPWHVYNRVYTKALKDLFFNRLLPRSFQRPSMYLIQNSFLHRTLVFYHHYLPAYVLDVLLYLRGSKLRLVKLYTFLDTLLLRFNFFLSNAFDFKTENFDALSEQMDSRDKEMFSLDRKGIDFQEMVREFPTATAFYDWSLSDKLSPEKRNNAVLKRTLLTNFIKGATLMLLGYILYRFMYFIFTISV